MLAVLVVEPAPVAEFDQQIVALELIGGPLAVVERGRLVDDIRRALEEDSTELPGLTQGLDRPREAAEDLGAELALDTQSVYAMFNNNGRSEMPSTGLGGIEPEEIAGDPAKGEVAKAPANALMLRRALQAAGVPVS